MADRSAKESLVTQLGREDGAHPDLLSTAVALLEQRFPGDMAMQRCYSCGHAPLVPSFGRRNQVGGPHDVHRDLDFHCPSCRAVMSYLV
jgi:hypothetical protein